MSDRWRSLFDAALSSERPMKGLRDVVVRLLREGAGRDAVQQSLEDYVEELRGAGREQDEDTVLDVLDFLTGWASPHIKIDDPDC